MRDNLIIDNKDEFKQLKKRVLKTLNPVKPADKDTLADKDFLFSAQKTEAGRQLPAYFLVYFLLVDLLGFKNLGQFEKIAWSVPIDFNGRAFLIEHRKFGLGVFAKDAEKDNKDAAEIVKRIKEAVKIAAPYFEFVATHAAKNSKLNVKNNSRELFARYEFFTLEFKTISKEARDREKERIVKRIANENGYAEITTFPSWELRKKSKWMAMSAIEAFFSWTEHIFIHLAILNGEILTGEEVANLAESDWQTKFKKSISLNVPEMKKLYDELTEIRRQLRNYIAHGAFGKRGEAFSFHSNVGAVPLLLPHQKGKPRFSFSTDLAFDEKKAINTIEKFIEILWKNEREPAKLYIQESDLPLILTYAADGTYLKAMKSTQDMEKFVEYLHYEWDRAANMDF